jgi:hypothetical protein
MGFTVKKYEVMVIFFDKLVFLVKLKVMSF